MTFARQFLHDPTHFPTPSTPTRKKGHDLFIDLVGGPYVFRGLTQVQTRELLARYGGRATSTGTADSATVPVEARPLPETLFRPVETDGWEMHIDFDYQPDHLRMAGLWFLARVELQPTLSATLWTPDTLSLVDTSAFENLFRTLVAYRLLEMGGVLLHSAGLAREGDSEAAWLFPGRSNAGKSTLSALGRDAGLTLLSDDMNALIPADDGFITEQLPFAGDFGQIAPSRKSWPVKAILHPCKSQSNRLRPMTDSDRLAQLMVCSPFVNTNPHLYDRLIVNLLRIRKSLPGAWLDFSISGGFETLL